MTTILNLPCDNRLATRLRHRYALARARSRFLFYGVRQPRLVIWAVAALVGAILPGLADATEGGGSSKAIGVDTVLCGVMPDPGLLLTTYLGYYNSDHTLNSSGNDRAGISNFHLRAEAATLRLQQVWSGVELWGANIETRVGFTPYVDINVNFDVQTPKGPVHRQSSASGTADALLGPALFGWHSEHWHQIAGVEFFLPTGHFDKTKLANQGRDYYATAPAYFFTWLPNDATEVSGNLFYLINAKNHDTDYRSGNELSFDYGVAYALTSNWQIGANGYLYKQIADDKQGGQVVGDGNRGRAVSIGPFVRYHMERNWGITLKWQHEALVENKTRGDRLFLQFAYRLW